MAARLKTVKLLKYEHLLVNNKIRVIFYQKEKFLEFFFFLLQKKDKKSFLQKKKKKLQIEYENMIGSKPEKTNEDSDMETRTGVLMEKSQAEIKNASEIEADYTESSTSSDEFNNVYDDDEDNESDTETITNTGNKKHSIQSIESETKTNPPKDYDEPEIKQASSDQSLNQNDDDEPPKDYENTEEIKAESEADEELEEDDDEMKF